jgi:hypothetical protein
MEYTITCNGLSIGTARLAPLAGLAHAEFRSLPAYAAVEQHAERATGLVQQQRYREYPFRDFAEDLARTWTGGRLAIVDPRGAEVAAASVMIVNATRVRGGARVIVDMRPDTARVAALIHTMPSDDGGRSRPAA